MKQVEQIKEDIEKKDKSRFLTFLVFLIISTVLWFLIKLSKEYTTQAEYTLSYTEVPVNKWVSTPSQTVKFSFVADGFVTLRHHLVPKQKRVVEIPLSEVPYRLEGGFTYSYSSQYVADRLAHSLDIAAGNITINDDKQFFNMEDLQSKELIVKVPLEVSMQRQFQLYGQPEVVPDHVTVFGPKNMLDTLTQINTLPLQATNLSGPLHSVLALDLYDGAIRSEVSEVTVGIDVEQYTETDIEVPVSISDSLELRFFPEKIRLKCMVPIRDFAGITPQSFLVQADTTQLHRLQPLLDVRLLRVPDYVQVIKMEPTQVEYLIIN